MLSETLAPAAPHTGVLIVNLGTPDAPDVPSVRRYLRQFLLDGRVIDIPAAQRWLLVNGIIAPFRAPKSTKGYKEVWMADGKGSPLKYYSQRVEALLQAELGPGYAVRLAMRYQNPSIAAGLAALKALPLSKIVVAPLFPQYASASTGSVIQDVMEQLSTWQTLPEVRTVSRFFDVPAVAQAYARRIGATLAEGGYDHVLFSYHGLPERQITKGDVQKVCVFGACCDTYTPANLWCYRAQCFANTRLLAGMLGLAEGGYSTSFQSRLGSTPWIKPYTDEHLKHLRAQGVTRLAVTSPAFVADCLETILEIGEEYRELWQELGGERLTLVPSLNDGADWVEALAGLVRG